MIYKKATIVLVSCFTMVLFGILCVGCDSTDFSGCDGTVSPPDSTTASDTQTPSDTDAEPDADNDLYDYSDNVPGSADPPGGLDVSQVPMFVSIGWDDNTISGAAGTRFEGGMRWILDFLATKTNPPGLGNKSTYDGTPVHNSFYLISNAAVNWGWDDPALVRSAWREAMEKGHEIGNHTRTHLKNKNGATMSEEEWLEEINGCTSDLQKSYPEEGIGLTNIYGFRAPRMEFSDNLYKALRTVGIMYDCSGVGGSQEAASSDGRGYYWPYTLDNGLPGKSSISSHPGIWRTPKLPLLDTDGKQYASTDYTLMENGMAAEQYLRVLKHTLDLRMESNRAPMLFGAHTELYTEGAEAYLAVPQMTFQERRDVIEAFINYALSFDDVRIVSTKEVLDWVRHPVPLDESTDAETTDAETTDAETTDAETTDDETTDDETTDDETTDDNTIDDDTDSASDLCEEWVRGQYYDIGDIVAYEGNNYIAVHENPGYNPTISTWFWDPTSEGCSQDLEPDPIPDPETEDDAETSCTGPWYQANLTQYTSYPDPGSEECTEYNGCTWAGQFFGVDGTQTEEWVASHNIAAVHQKDWGWLGLKQIKLRQGDKEIVATVYDLCSDSDCNGCCTQNLGPENDDGSRYLIDIEHYTMERFGSGDGIVEFQICE